VILWGQTDELVDLFVIIRKVILTLDSPETTL